MLVQNIAWSRGTLFKYRIDPNRFMDVYYPPEIQYRALAVGIQGAAELRPGRTLAKPVAVYPVWNYGQDTLEFLEEILANPIGLSESKCRDSRGSPDERPILGQEHRVVITGLPNPRHSHGIRIYSILKDMQEEYSDAIFHLHGPTSFGVAFGRGFRSADIDVRTVASHGNIMLANNKQIPFEEASNWAQWIKLANMKASDLSVARNRCMFNIASALWAAENWEKNLAFSVKPGHSLEVKHPYNHAKPMDGDKFLCDTCSLQTKCKFFRHQGVCSVPDAEPAQLARFFKTRNSDEIIEGLGILLAVQSRRLEDGLKEEAVDGLKPEVSRILNNLFDQGIKLAKLVDPRLAAASATRVAVQVNNNQPGLPSTNVNAFMAAVVAHYEEQGIARGSITPEMINAAMIGPKAIDAGVTDD
jgi:hypothetical protein